MAVFFAALGLLAPVACAFGELTDAVLYVCVENVESRFSKTTKTPISLKTLHWQMIGDANDSPLLGDDLNRK